MKIEKLEQELLQYEEKLKGRIREEGVTRISEITNEKVSSLSQYIHGDRIYSYKKIMELCKILRIKV